MSEMGMFRQLRQHRCGGGSDNFRFADHPGTSPFVDTSAFMRTQLISYRLPKADSALLRSLLSHHLCRIVPFRQVD
jgi:hypothetical protein